MASLSVLLIKGRPDDNFGNDRWIARMAADRENPREMRRSAIKHLAAGRLGRISVETPSKA